MLFISSIHYSVGACVQGIKPPTFAYPKEPQAQEAGIAVCSPPSNHVTLADRLPLMEGKTKEELQRVRKNIIDQNHHLFQLNTAIRYLFFNSKQLLTRRFPASQLTHTMQSSTWPRGAYQKEPDPTTSPLLPRQSSHYPHTEDGRQH
jgi:hypothetical protein